MWLHPALFSTLTLHPGHALVLPSNHSRLTLSSSATSTNRLTLLLPYFLSSCSFSSAVPSRYARTIAPERGRTQGVCEPCQTEEQRLQ